MNSEEEAHLPEDSWKPPCNQERSQPWNKLGTTEGRAEEEKGSLPWVISLNCWIQPASQGLTSGLSRQANQCFLIA